MLAALKKTRSLTLLSAKKQAARASMVADAENLSQGQRFAGQVLMEPWFQLLITGIIISHMALTIYETDQNASNAKREPWQDICEKSFMTIYLLDLALRLFTLRWGFFQERMNIFDLSLVTLDTTFAVLDSITEGAIDVGGISLLRSLRALRIVRVIRNFASFRDLYLMMKGMLGAVRAIFFAFLLIASVLTFFSIIAVEMLHPINKRLSEAGFYKDCSRCHRAFASVLNSNLTFFSTILAGDSWGKMSIPIIEDTPATAAVIISAFVVLELGLLNVIVAVVVDRQAQAREEDKELQHTLKQEQAQASYKELVRLFKEMDNDNSGSLTLDELVDSYEKFDEFKKILKAVDVDVSDLSTIFTCMDRDGNGSVNYEEFIMELHRIRTMEIRTLVYLTKQQVMETQDTVKMLAEHVMGKVPTQTRPSEAQRSAVSHVSHLSNGDTQAHIGSCEWSRQVPRPSPSVSNGVAQMAKQVDDQLRLMQLEQQVLTLESKVAESACHGQSWGINKHMPCKSTGGAGHGTSEKLKIASLGVEDVSADDTVPELSPSCVVAPGEDMRGDEFEDMRSTSLLASGEEETMSLKAPPLATEVAAPPICDLLVRE